jgi:hypothetical protein
VSECAIGLASGTTQVCKSGTAPMSTRVTPSVSSHTHLEWLKGQGGEVNEASAQQLIRAPEPKAAVDDLVPARL